MKPRPGVHLTPREARWIWRWLDHLALASGGRADMDRQHYNPELRAALEKIEDAALRYRGGMPSIYVESDDGGEP